MIFGLNILGIQKILPETEQIVEEEFMEEQIDNGPYLHIEKDDELLRKYQEYNSDCIGLIRIPGTVLNHPLMQTKEDEEYYLFRDLNKEYNSHGVPFVEADCDVEEERSNLVIYGHNIHLNSVDVFGELARYESLGYYKRNPYIETVSKSGTCRWLIFAYWIQDNSDRDPFRYSEYTKFQSEASFNEFMSKLRERNWLDVKVDVEFGDNLITLSSCSNELSGSGTNRMVVVGKMLDYSEDCSEIIEKAQMAPDPLLPEKMR